ncbi:hypothetical protein [Hansschlegelia plantiphila]|uniref:Uncharacterized protein n=1 Tax=Hansschlegelia plantiphila TaxID=374655 RepID=A0A9W6J1A0_9HYPH|nr:hypothetical protein [Hansschlegelia plantiphila]GLK67878.1 hypothetical protein GCM10008179_15160 [Hansschlegelia plantiphila]
MIVALSEILSLAARLRSALSALAAEMLAGEGLTQDERDALLHQVASNAPRP